MSEEVLTSEEDGVLIVTINRPEAKNAMTKAAAEGIAAAMDRLIRNPVERLALARSGQTYVLATHTPQRRAAELKGVRQTVIARRLARQTTGTA